MVLANEWIFKITTNKEAEVRLQSLADNLPGVVFQYLIYTDGTDNLKYVTKGSKGVGIFCRGSTTEPAVSLGWNGRWRNGNLKKNIAGKRPKQNGLLNGNI
jgi:hypothetical protein